VRASLSKTPVTGLLPPQFGVVTAADAVGGGIARKCARHLCLPPVFAPL
jgi:hypothetical protein